MSLLSQASLVVVPSGYKEDVVYSVKPTDGSGDLTFTRASDGTRVNSQGLVEVTPWNAMQYSEDFANAVWGIPNGGSSVVVTSAATTAPNGTTTADKIEIANGTNDRIEQVSTAPILTSGLPCTFSVYIKSISGTGKVGIRSGQSGASSVLSYTNEWQRLTWTFNAFGTYEIPQFCNNTLVSGADSAPSFYAWGAQLNIGSTAKPYFPTTNRQDVPRLDYSGGCPSLLLEPQRTNINTYSEDFSNAAYAKENATITTNQTTSPDGTSNADKLTDNSTNNYHIIYPNSLSITTSKLTASIYVKNNDIQFCAFQLATSIGGTYDTRFTLIVDLINGTITDTESVGTPNAVYSIQNIGNGWYRLLLTCDHSSGLFAFVVGGSNSGTPSTFVAALPTYIGTGKSFFIWGAQLEAGSYATSYIPTTSASVTRVADAASKTGISSLIGQTEGTLFVDLNRSFLTQTYDRYAVLDDADGSIFRTGVFVLPEPSVDGRIYIILRNNSADVFQYTFNNTTDQRLKIAVAYKSGDMAIYINGAQEAISSTSYTFAHTLQQVKHSGNSIAVNQTVLFKTRLTNAELAALTTL